MDLNYSALLVPLWLISSMIIGLPIAHGFDAAKDFRIDPNHMILISLAWPIVIWVGLWVRVGMICGNIPTYEDKQNVDKNS